MAGHSKWANIKHKKGREDAKKAKVFTKIIKELTVAAKGGSNIEDNPRLRLIVEKAYSVNMTKDTIERAIARGAGANEADNIVEIVYEGYGPCAIAVIVEVATDNKNRAAAEVRHAFSKCGGNLGQNGSVSFMFNRLGQMQFKGVDMDALMIEALESGAEDIFEEEDFIVVQTSFVSFHSVLKKLIDKNLKPLEAELTMIANIETPISDLSSAQKIIKLIEMLEDLDDVQNVYHNADIPLEILNQIE